MRKMFSQKQIEKIAAEYAGGLPEIEAGDAGKALIVNAGETGVEWATVGLSPEDQEKLDNSLQLPESAPAAQQLVGINTSGEQNALGIGDYLTVDNGVLKYNGLEFVIVNFNSNSSIGISDDLYNKLYSTADIIIYAVNTSFKPAKSCLYTHANAGTKFTQVTINASGGTSTPAGGGFKFNVKAGYKIELTGDVGARKLNISKDSEAEIVTKVMYNYDLSVSFTEASGTKTGYSSKLDGSDINFMDLTYRPEGNNVNKTVSLRVLEIDKSTANNYTLLAEGKNASYIYTLNWNLSTGAYTITATAIQ